MTKQKNIIELFKLIGIIFHNMHLKAQNAKPSDTIFNKKKIIAKSTIHKYKKTAANQIYSPNRFELLHCETTENNNNDQSYDKSISIFEQVSNGNINPNTKH